MVATAPSIVLKVVSRTSIGTIGIGQAVATGTSAREAAPSALTSGTGTEGQERRGGDNQACRAFTVLPPSHATTAFSKTAANGNGLEQGTNAHPTKAGHYAGRGTFLPSRRPPILDGRSAYSTAASRTYVEALVPLAHSVSHPANLRSVRRVPKENDG